MGPYNHVRTHNGHEHNGLSITYIVSTLDDRLEGVAFPLIHVATERACVSDVITSVRSTQDTLKLS